MRDKHETSNRQQLDLTITITYKDTKQAFIGKPNVNRNRNRQSLGPRSSATPGAPARFTAI